jgi:hypothetical protein
MVFSPGTLEKDPKKQNIALQRHAAGIATNTTDIATNTADIATNTTDIATNTANIATNTTNIATNTTNIATNTTDIAAIKAAWTSYTPTVSATSGTLTTTSTTGRYLQIGKTVYFTAQVTLTNVGTASGRISLGLPKTAGASSYVVAGVERQSTGNAITGLVGSGGTTALIDGYSGLTPNMIVNGYVLLIGGVYESA